MDTRAIEEPIQLASALAHEVRNPLATMYLDIITRFFKFSLLMPAFLRPISPIRLGGMGLGLSTTMDILKANHAMVDVHSEEGKGTRFILSFEGIQPSGD
jgi:signal transduction histidine kinase